MIGNNQFELKKVSSVAMEHDKSNIPQVNDEYNFLVHFEVNQGIRNKANSLDEIFDAFKSQINEHDIREIFIGGLDTRFKKSNNFKIIQVMHQTLFDSDVNNILRNANNSNYVSNINTNDKQGSNLFNCNPNHDQSIATITPVQRCRHLDVFKIQILMCSIFSYLDFKSILKCSQVNKQWMYDSYCPMSIAFISTKSMYKENRHGTRVIRMGRRSRTRLNSACTNKVSCQCFYNINRFKNASSLKIFDWPQNCQLDKYFRNFEKFRNISKLELTINFDRELNLISTIIKNNKDKLKELTINNTSIESFSKCPFLETIFLPHLIVLRISRTTVQALQLQSQSQSQPQAMETSVGFSDNHLSKLQHLIIDKCHLDIEFWMCLANEKTNLSNMTHLSFVGCKINAKDQKIIESNYVAKLVSKLDNLTHFTCNCNMNENYRCTRWTTTSTSETNVNLVIILSSFLRHLSQGKARKVLKSLDIVLTTKWFLNIQESEDKSKSVEIKTGECVFNFENLENISISFKKWKIPSSHTFDDLDQIQLIHKAFAIFCMRQQSRGEVGQQMLSSIQ